MASEGQAGPALRASLGSGTDGAQAVLARARDAADAAVVLEVGPTGVTALEPLVMATVGGRTAFHGNVSPDDAARLVATLEDGTVPADGAVAVVEHDPGTPSLPVPDDGPLGVGARRTLGRCGWVEPAAVGGVASDGVTDAVRADPTAALERIEALGLLGRGRGDARTDEPVAGAWADAREAAGEAVVVVNANERDPVAAGDRLLCEGVPAEVLDAALGVAAAVGAPDVVAYAGEADALARERLADAAAALSATDLTDGVGVQVVAGPDEFKAGEPTMALESMEGSDRLEARLRPPGPAEHGLHGRPTVVHTPRTLAQVRAALLDVRKQPAPTVGGTADPGTRLVTVGGDVAAPATVELPTDAPLSAATDAVEADGWRMACVGGRFGGLTRGLELPASAPALSAADLGTNGAVELFDAGRCPVATAGRRAAFAETENCGRCVPCREGSTQLAALLRDVYGGSYEDGKLRELARVMAATSTCQFGREAARPVVTAMDAFASSFRAHAEGRCPAGACEVGS